VKYVHDTEDAYYVKLTK